MHLLTIGSEQQTWFPCSSREKASYEGLSKRTRFCSICKLLGHKKTTCPEGGDMLNGLANLQAARIVASLDTVALRAPCCWVLLHLKSSDGHVR
uniref:Uncharacterized protein n=1 Tax=Aegilops tauschii subsp. strangulata TaxID=200361 RepID=A0A453IEF4_AEGTS